MKTATEIASQIPDYRILLRDRVDELIKKRPQLSLRSISKKIEMDQSYFSQFLRCKKHTSRETTRRMASFVGMKPNEIQYLLKISEYQRARSDKLKQDLLQELKGSKFFPKVSTAVNLELARLEMVRDWYHPAILHLAEIENFKVDALSISRRLKIPQHRARQALTRLETLGLLRVENDRYITTDEIFKTTTGVPNSARRSYHDQMIKKGNEALHQQDLQQRSISGVTLSTNLEGLGRARELIQEFQEQLIAEISPSKALKDRIYQLNIQFFQLDQHSNPSSERESK